MLGDLVDFVGGGTPRRDRSDYWGGDIPWASVKDLQGQLLETTIESITPEGLANSASNLIAEGTVIIASRVGLGKVAINQKPVAINQDLKALTPRTNDLLPRYLLLFLLSKAEYFQRAGVGATVKGLTIGDYQKLKIVLPPLAEQERIAKLLDETNELRMLRAQADRRTTALIPALLHEMFGDPFENSKGWDVHPVSSFVAELFGGRNVNPAGADEAAGRFRVLKISAVTWGDFRPEESKPVPTAYEPPASHFVRVGDLLFSRANTAELVAATSYVFETPPNLLLPDKLWRFVWKEPLKVEPFFVWWMFQAASVRRELARRATGSGGSMKNISKPKVMTLQVPVPPLSLQREFAKRAIEIRALESGQAASRHRLDDLFQSLLHRAFNGQL
jgi:type I restriction enzyme S subunit